MLELWVERSEAGSTSCCLAPQSATSLGLPATILPTLFLQLPPCHESSLPGCPSLPLLQVCVNVSSLIPCLSDFHTVRFSVSSGCFLFINCYCPSFGCARRHSVSTYTSTLARSASLSLFLLMSMVKGFLIFFKFLNNQLLDFFDLLNWVFLFFFFLSLCHLIQL